MSKPVKHVQRAMVALSRPDRWTLVKTYPNINTARVMATRVRTGNYVAYGSLFEAKATGTRLYVKPKGEGTTT